LTLSVFFAELFAEHDNPPRGIRLDFVAKQPQQ